MRKYKLTERRTNRTWIWDNNGNPADGQTKIRMPVDIWAHFAEMEDNGIQITRVSNVVFEPDKMIVRLDNPEDLKYFYRDFFLIGEKYNYTYIASLIFSPPVIFSFSGPHKTTREFSKKLEEEGYKVIEGEI